MHRTEVYVMVVTQELDEWEDSRSICRKRQWFTIEDALLQLALHKPTQRHYLQQLCNSKHINSSETPTIITTSTTTTENAETTTTTTTSAPSSPTS